MNQPQLVECRLIQDWRAPKQIDNGAKVEYKTFKKDETVYGYPFQQGSSDTGANFVSVLKTKDGFIIPESYLNVIGEAKQVSAEDASKTPQTTTDSPSTTALPGVISGLAKTRTKIAIRGAMIGAGLGLAYTFWKGGNKIMFASMGALGGFIAGNMYAKSKEE